MSNRLSFSERLLTEQRKLEFSNTSRFLRRVRVRHLEKRFRAEILEIINDA